jgi:hypothetical protein
MLSLETEYGIAVLTFIILEIPSVFVKRFKGSIDEM